MNSPIASLSKSPVRARVAPFVAFIALTFAQGYCGEAGRYWLYVARTLLAAGLLWSVRSVVPEMRWRFSFAAVIAGALVFVVWIGLDGLLIRLGLPHSYPKLNASGGPWNPHLQFGQDSILAWLFIAVRLGGSALVVPPLEEVFFRSFLYRYIASVDFQSVPLGAFLWVPFVATSVLFGLEHREWLAGIFCGCVYQGLVCWKKRLDDAISAHAITNALLGCYVVWKGGWEYW